MSNSNLRVRFFFLKSIFCISYILSFLSCVTSICAINEKKKLFFNAEENIESYFPLLAEITDNLEQTAPSLKESRQIIKEANSQKIIADSSKGISVNMNLSGVSIHENRPGQSYYQSYRTVGSIYAKKPLYHWGALNAKSRVAELSEKYAIHQTTAAKENLIYQIKSEFMNLVFLNYEKNLAKETLSLNQQNEEDLLKRKELGMVTELEVNQATIKKLEQSIKIAEINRLLITKKAYFRFDTGYYNSFDLDISDKFERFYNEHDFGKNIPQIVGSLSSQNIEQLKNQIETENENIKVANSNLKPKVNLVGGFYQDQIDLPDNPDSVRRNNFLVGIEANWALWDSGHSKGLKSLALAKKLKFEIQLESNTKKLRLEMNSLRSELLNLAKQIEVSRQLVATSKNRFEKSQIEFDANRKTSTDYFASQLGLSVAKLSLIKSVFTYLQVKEKYDFHLKYPK